MPYLGGSGMGRVADTSEREGVRPQNSLDVLGESDKCQMELNTEVYIGFIPRK